MLNNRIVQSHIQYIDFNKHGRAEMIRVYQEGIAFSFRYGFDILRENGINSSVIRAGYTNLFLSPLFCSSFVNTTSTPVELLKATEAKERLSAPASEFITTVVPKKRSVTLIKSVL